MMNNQFWGSIPTELGMVTVLDEIFMSGNLLTGTIPTQLEALTNIGKKDTVSCLVFLVLYARRCSTNTFSFGFIRICRLPSPPSEWLTLYSNDLTGTMPTGLCNLRDMRQIVMLEVDCNELECECCSNCK